MDNKFIRFGSKLYKNVDTYCVPLVADFTLFCFETDSMLFLPDNYRVDVIEARNSITRSQEY